MKLNNSITCIIKFLKFFLLLLPVNCENNSISKEYGVLCYDYNHVKIGDSKYYPNNVNLGDYIQSLAAWQYLPKNYEPTFIDRDTLKLYSGPNVTMIMNGWYFLNKDNEYFSDNINPIFVSLHINNVKNINHVFIEYLKKYQPIGCRDKNTQLNLNKHGVEAYFSGCLTTTLDIDYKVKKEEKNDAIIFCDYKFGKYPQADEILKSMKNYDFSKVETTTHSFTKNSTHEERFMKAKELLNKYAKAKLVVTTRIHCALPCLAMGTPVILINKNYDRKRYDGLYELLNTIGKNKNNKFAKNIKLDKSGNIVNSNKYLEYSKKIKGIYKEKNIKIQY